MSLRSESRKTWGIRGSKTTEGELKAGALMRIADATEAMAKNHVQLQRDRDNYERWYLEEVERRQILERRLASTQGWVTRLKRRLAEAPDA